MSAALPWPSLAALPAEMSIVLAAFQDAQRLGREFSWIVTWDHGFVDIKTAEGRSYAFPTPFEAVAFLHGVRFGQRP